MQDSKTGRDFVGRRIEITFVYIARRAGVDQIIERLISARRNRAEMVHCQRRTNICLRNATVTTALVESMANGRKQRMCHNNVTLSTRDAKFGTLFRAEL